LEFQNFKQWLITNGELSIYVMKIGMQSPIVVIAHPLEFESNSSALDSHHGCVGYDVHVFKIVLKRYFNSYFLTDVYQTIYSEKKSPHTNIFNFACKIAVLSHYRSFIIDLKPLE